MFQCQANDNTKLYETTVASLIILLIEIAHCLTRCRRELQK